MAVLEPASVAEISAILRDAGAARRSVIPIGARTALRAIPSSASAASLLSTRALAGALDHVPGDLVATIPAGASLGEVNRALGREGQCLPLDPPHADLATIGGIVASNSSGPRRHRYGAPRDLIIGINVVLADGRAAKAGGRVVKNVAGYDLSRLMCGSLGSLAVITSATFKLSPTAPASCTVVATIERAAALGDLLQALVNAPLTPSTIEVVAPPTRLLIRFETTNIAADHMAKAACAICERFGASAIVVTGEDERDQWSRAEEAVWRDDRLVLKLAVLPTDVPYMLSEIETGCAACGVEWHAAGRAALGVVFASLQGSIDTLRPLVADWRHRAAVRGGSLVVESAAPGLEQIDRWGDAPSAMPVMRAVKQRFDPNGILSPGMGPGGL
jgi:glycolate oxidase FAD binding subunit